ncbi:ABC transporter ATP-binding protein [Vannielia litorea]|uniref:ATP-binding cassette, subfamily B, MsbA n=1 Tax=Vannielia litorea TaxID=1217970 RepID=A0A1N6GAC3_9RHOB|nr:ABC transporter ATP-binding protein [Vannielia litorea]SIO04427.1 ATP-binding cassette, subfamily B, MsbA [Vannielia litorea]
MKPEGSLSWLWRGYLRPHWPALVGAGLLMAVEGSMLGFLSYMMKPMFDAVFVAGESGALWAVGLGILAIFFIRAATSVGQKLLLARVASKVIYKMKTRLVAHLMRLDTTWHGRNPPGALIERVSNDTGAVREVASVVITGLGRDVVALVSLLAVVLWIDWQWTLVALMGTPLLVAPTLLVQSFIRRTALRNRVLAQHMSVRLDEVFHGINPIKLNRLEDYQSRQFDGLAAERVDAEVRNQFGRAAVPALIDIMTGIGFFAVLIYGGREIMDGEKTVGEFMSFFTAMALAFEPLRRLGQISGVWQAAQVSLGRVREMFDVRPSLTSPAAPRAVSPGDIEFKDVHLSYGEAQVLNGLSLVARAGETTALVGASGAGKSTVFNLLTRLVDPSSGTITLGGTPIDALGLPDLRAQFSMVSQEALLFDDTLRENIVLGSEVSEERLEAALRGAHVTDFVRDFPEGLDSPAGPRGSSLSGGQRQRIAIARALLRDAPILLLDEATSALDTKSEAVVQAALDELAQGRTTLVIAHRLSTVRGADRILVMQAGRVVEEGTHEALLDKGGAYAELYRLQFADEA